MLQCGTGQNANRLAQACGVSRRTTFRDLESLRDSGVPIQFDRVKEQYSIPGGFFLPPTNFTAAESLSLIALAGELGQDKGVPFYQAARSAAMKLESSLPSALREKMQDMTRSIHMRLPQINRLEGKETLYQMLIDARAARRVVRIEYDSLTEWEVITTKLRPYTLLFSHRSWYVIGRSSAHSEVRTFNVSRIVSAETLKTQYVLPRGFSIDRYLRNAWHLMPGTGRDYDVCVRFKPLVAKNVAEVVWHKTQTCKFLDKGSLEFRAKVSGLHEIAWWVLGYGDQAEVLRPTKLRKLVSDRVRNMAKIYEKQ